MDSMENIVSCGRVNKTTVILCSESLTRFLYNWPSSRPSSKSFLISGHILVLKFSQKFFNLLKKQSCKRKRKKLSFVTSVHKAFWFSST